MCLSVLAAAALHGEEAGEAKDEGEERTSVHCCGEVRIGTRALILEISRSAEKHAHLQKLASVQPRISGPKLRLLACLPTPAGSNQQMCALNFFLCKNTAFPLCLSAGSPRLLRLFPRSTHARRTSLRKCERVHVEWKYVEIHRFAWRNTAANLLFGHVQSHSFNFDERHRSVRRNWTP